MDVQSLIPHVRGAKTQAQRHMLTDGETNEDRVKVLLDNECSFISLVWHQDAGAASHPSVPQMLHALLQRAAEASAVPRSAERNT